MRRAESSLLSLHGIDVTDDGVPAKKASDTLLETLQPRNVLASSCYPSLSLLITIDHDVSGRSIQEISLGASVC